MNTDNKEVLVQRADGWTAERPVYTLRPHSSYSLQHWYSNVEFPIYCDGAAVLPFKGSSPVSLLSLRELRAVSSSGGPATAFAILAASAGRVGGDPPQGSLLVWFAEPGQTTGNSFLTLESLDRVRMCHPEDETIPVFFVDFKGIR